LREVIEDNNENIDIEEILETKNQEYESTIAKIDEVKLEIKQLK